MVQPEFLKLIEVHPERVAIAEQYMRMAGLALLRREYDRAQECLEQAKAEMSVVDVLDDEIEVSAIFGRHMCRLLAAAGIVTIGQLRKSDASGQLSKIVSPQSVWRIRKKLAIYGLSCPDSV